MRRTSGQVAVFQTEYSPFGARPRSAGSACPAEISFDTVVSSYGLDVSHFGLTIIVL